MLFSSGKKIQLALCIQEKIDHILCTKIGCVFTFGIQSPLAMLT